MSTKEITFADESGLCPELCPGGLTSALVHKSGLAQTLKNESLSVLEFERFTESGLGITKGILIV